MHLIYLTVNSTLVIDFFCICDININSFQILLIIKIKIKEKFDFIAKHAQYQIGQEVMKTCCEATYQKALKQHF